MKAFLYVRPIFTTEENYVCTTVSHLLDTGGSSSGIKLPERENKSDNLGSRSDRYEDGHLLKRYAE